MNGESRKTGSAADELANIAILALLGLLAIALVLRAAGAAAAFLTGTAQPASGIASGVGVLFHPADPGRALGTDGLNPIAYWVVAGLLLVGSASTAAGAGIAVQRHSRQRETDPRRITGTATAAEIARAASTKALLSRAENIRPSLDRPRPHDIGYLLGKSRGKEVWASAEDSILLIGPPRSGKGLHVVINAILDAPGAVVTTSTRPDNLAATLRARQRIGQVAVFDPQHLTEGLPAGLRWSPV